nr:hypothetical protein [uncultured Acetatifactor sp.]
MKNENFLTVLKSNVRINHKHTLIPSILLLLVIPLIYGTANLDCVKSADCLERMTALIGIPMFTPLLYREQSEDLYSIVALRPFPLRAVAALQIGISAVEALGLILAFEVSMAVRGSTFPVGAYAFRTLAACMALGFTGLLCASAMKNVVAGYLGAFVFCFAVQARGGGSLFRAVTNGIQPPLLLFLFGAAAAILFAVGRPGGR